MLITAPASEPAHPIVEGFGLVDDQVAVAGGGLGVRLVVSGAAAGHRELLQEGVRPLLPRLLRAPLGPCSDYLVEGQGDHPG